MTEAELSAFIAKETERFAPFLRPEKREHFQTFLRELADEVERDHPRCSSSEEVALSRIGGTLPDPIPYDEIGLKGQIIPGAVGGEQCKRIMHGIDQTMSAVISKDVRHNPVWSGPGPATVRPAGAAPAHSGPRSTGWHDPGPLGPPGGATAQAAISALADSYQPHQPSNPEYRPGSKGKQP